MISRSLWPERSRQRIAPLPKLVLARLSMVVRLTAATRICRACRPRRTTLAAQYLWETGYGSFTPRVDATYKKDTNACFDWASCQWQDGKGMEYDFYALNARLTWQSRDEKFRVTAYGNNLTDNQSARPVSRSLVLPNRGQCPGVIH